MDTLAPLHVTDRRTGALALLHVTVRQFLERRLDERCAGIPLPGEHQQFRQVGCDSGPLHRVACELQRLAQVLDRRWIGQHLLGKAQLVQQRGTQAHIGRFRECPPQIGRRALGRTTPHRPRRGHPQLVHHLMRPSRLAHQQMRAHHIGIRALRGQQSRRRRVTQPVFGLRNVIVHCPAHDRVHEPQRCPRLEYSDPGQPVSGRRGVRQPHPGQRRGVA